MGKRKHHVVYWYPVQFELRLLTVGGDRRLGLLARMKTWRENSNEQLSGQLDSMRVGMLD